MEEVGIVERDWLERCGLLAQGFSAQGAQVIATIDAALMFLDRVTAEREPRFKQPIPYVLVERAGQWFVSERIAGGSESRLHGRLAMGVGGHIDPADAESGFPVLAALQREWMEEVVCSHVPEFEFVGVVNDDSFEVGRVHIGIVFVAHLPAEATLDIREVDRLVGAFRSTEWISIERARFESWSMFAAQALGVVPAP
jgi:predicted NUDIX family phosphoesterase